MLSNREHLGAFIGLVRRVTPTSWDLGGALHTALVQVNEQKAEAVY